MAQGQSIGNAYLTVKAQPDKSFKSELDKAGGSAGESAGNLFNGKFGGALKKIGGVIGALGIGKIIGDTIADSIKAYADYQQLVGGVETLFKQSADMVQKYAAQAYKTQGMSANAYMEAVTGFSGALLRSLGGDTEAAAKMANMAITDMSDQANKYGMTVDRVKDTYMSLARGQFMTLDNLFGGMFAGTKQGLRDMLDYAERYRASLGETVSYSEDSYADIVSAIHDVSESLGVAGTTAQEAATTLSGAWNSAKAAFDNWLVALADPEGDVAGSTQQMMDSMIHIIEMAAPVLGNTLGNLIGQLPGIIIEHIPEIVEAIVMMVVKMGESFLNGLDNLFTDFGNWVAKLVNGTDEAGDQMAAATGEGVDEAVAEVKRLPSETDAALAGLDYSDSGYAVGHSFAQGILGRIGEVSNASMQLALAASAPLPHSPAKIGPFSGRGWTLYSGESVADAFAEGFTRRMAAVQAQIASGMGGIASTISRGTATTYNIDMSVTADSTTTLDSLINQARRARALNGGY